MQSPHPDDQTLKAYGLGKLVDEQASTVDEHLECCADCRQRISGLTSDSFLGRFRDGHQPSAKSIPVASLDDGTMSFMQAKTTSPPPSTDTLPPGLANHPDYEIKRELGRGGMGVVYLAHNTMMGRDEVLKVMGRHIMERPGVLERFQREIRAVAKLRHPNIVAAYHAFRIEGGLVFSMEYVEGLDLSRLIKAKGPLTVAQATYFVHQAALGLQHAHEKGLIHRDIKPHNLMLTHDGKARLVKVLDFGLAKATREEKVDGGLTSEGQALGTPDYIAPEQIVNALDVDIRADLYSLGGTLFYLLTGRPPFQATSLYDIYQAHMSRDAEPLNLIRPEVPAELAALVAKMMAKEPRRRFQTPAEVAQALTPFFKSKPSNLQAETSRVLPVEPRPLRIIDTPAPTEVAEKVARPTSHPDTTAVSIESRKDSATDFAELGLISIEEKPHFVSRSGTPRWVWLTVTAAAVLFISFLALFVLDLRVNTPEGTIVLKGLPGDAIVLIDGKKVKITWPGDDKPAEISAVPGEHKLEVSKDGFRTFGKTVQFQRGGSEPVIVLLEPLEANRPTETLSVTKDVPRTASPASGFVPLFNGKNLEGWTELLSNTSEWKVVEGGLLEGRGNGVGNMAVLVSQRQDFANFRFRTRFRYTRGNSGWIEFRRAPKESNSFAYFVATGKNPSGSGSMGSLSWSSGHQYGQYFDWKVKTEVPDAKLYTWYTLEISAIGNRITTSVDGKKLVEYVDFQERYRSGAIALMSNGGSTMQFQEVLIEKIPDDNPTPAKFLTAPESAEVKPAPPGALSDLDRVATGKWVRLVDSSTVLPEKEKMKFQNGILELNDVGLPFEQIVARDAIIRAKVLKVDGQVVKLRLRVGDGYAYGAGFHGSDKGGDHFFISRIYNPLKDLDKPFTILADSHIGRKIQPGQYVEMALATIGDTLTLFVDGKKTISVKDSLAKSGFLAIFAGKSTSRFKQVECQILDPAPISENEPAKSR